MADDADRADELVAARVGEGLARAAAPIAAGEAGWCDGCGHFFPRLVDGQCGFCRDGRLPPDDWEPHPPPAGAARPPITITCEAPPLPAEESIMSKSLTIPSDCEKAIKILEAHARKANQPVGRAAAELIERGAAPPAEQPAPVVALEDVHLDALLAEVKRRFELLPAGDALDAANARADALQGRLDTISAALAA